jgi:hypothetical protein
MLKFHVIVLLAALNILTPETQSQDETDIDAMYKSWALFQVIPSPVIFNDADEHHSKIQLGLRWQVIPLNISFRSNKYTSAVQFFKINPVRRFTGSMDFFIQPEWTVSGYKYAKLARFGLSGGSRVIFPIKGDGEKISFSLGAKYTHRSNYKGNNNGYWGAEAGVYALFGFVGLQFNYNFDKRTRYNIGFYFKYF